jgi:ATP-binding cassette subfamily C (CFTR/MRP) protein 1
VNVVDNNLPQTLRQMLLLAFQVVSTVIIISYSTPVFLVVIVPIVLLYYLVQVS